MLLLVSVEGLSYKDAAGVQDCEALRAIANKIEILLDQKNGTFALFRNAFDDQVDLLND